MELCIIRKDLKEYGLKVPAWKDKQTIYIQPKYPIEYRWIANNFQVKLGEWWNAYSIDFDFID